MQFYPYVPNPNTDDVDLDALYADKIVVDSGGIDFYDGGHIEMSASFEGLDRFAVALAALGNDEDEKPKDLEFYEGFLSERTDQHLESLAFAALTILAERGAGQ